jgi:hypothetical protein
MAGRAGSAIVGSPTNRKEAQMNHTEKIAIAVAGVLAVAAITAGCGGSEESDSTDASTAGAPYDISYGEFIADLEPEKTAILKAYVADTPSCNADADRGFLLEISAVATDYDPSPLSDVVSKYC